MSVYELPGEAELKAWSVSAEIPNFSRTAEFNRAIGVCLDTILASEPFKNGDESKIRIDPRIKFMLLPRVPIEAVRHFAWAAHDGVPDTIQIPTELSHVSIGVSKLNDQEGQFIKFAVSGHPASSRSSWVDFVYDPRQMHDYWIFDGTISDDMKALPYLASLNTEGGILNYEINIKE